MRHVYRYADETGNLDYGADTGFKPGATPYFGFGTAVYYGDHGDALMAGLKLRTTLAAGGVELPKGFHAKDDSHHTRGQVFDALRAQAPRFDSTRRSCTSGRRTTPSRPRVRCTCTGSLGTCI